jgi:hypothetical protein
MQTATDFYTAESECESAVSGIGAHVCTYAEARASCVALNFYGGLATGWYGDLGGPDDQFETWDETSCASPNNTGGPKTSTSALPYRCCY